MRLLYNVGQCDVTIYTQDGDIISSSSRLFAHQIPLHILLHALCKLHDEFTEWGAAAIIGEGDIIQEILPAEEEIDTLSAQIIDEIHQKIEQLQSRGLSLRTIREALRRYQHVSPIEVTEDYRIILPDYGGIEVKMRPLPKALYLLFLRHPEGIRLKELSLYAPELLQIYEHLAPNLNPHHRIRSVELLTNPFCNSICEKISLINKAFSSILDDSLLLHYCIIGTKSEAYRVERNLKKY